MKIDPETKHQKLAQHVNFQLSFFDVSDTRSSVIILLMMCDLPLLLGLLSIYKMVFLWILLPFILLFHLWGIRLLIKNPYSTQMETVLFVGLLNLFGSISSFMMILGMSYYAFYITSSLYYIVLIVTTLILYYVFIKHQIDKYAGDPTKERKRMNQSKFYPLLAAAPANGYNFHSSIQDTYMIKHIVALVCVYFFSLFFMYLAAKFIHRYFFIRVNMNFVNYYPLTYKKRKKVHKQGIEIK